MLKGVVIGFVLAVIILVGGFYYYFAAGMAPVAIADPLMPFERKLAHMALDAHIQKQRPASLRWPLTRRTILPARRCTSSIAPRVTGCPASHPPIMRPLCFPNRPSCLGARA